MILLAPLAREAGGYGWCKDPYGQIAGFSNKEDPDYQAILRAVRAAKARQEKAGRYDIPGFRPNEHYVRWMKRFGILPKSFDLAKDPINPYETDKAYWRSLWHRPAVDRDSIGPTAELRSCYGAASLRVALARFWRGMMCGPEQKDLAGQP